MNFSRATHSLSRLTIIVLATLFFAQCGERDEDLILPRPEGTVEQKLSPQRIETGKLACSSCDFVVAENTSVFDGKKEGVKPGDIICLRSAFRYPRLTFENIVGTAEAPVIVTNCDGDVTLNTPGAAFVLRFNNSSFLRLTGGQSEGQYGIRLTGAEGNGLVMGYLTSNFEVDHLEVFRVGFAGIMAKTDPSCDDASVRGNYTMRDVSFHHNYIHDTHGEGFYIGHSSYGGKETACGFRLPHLIENVKVYDNIIRNSGWDAIQVASAPVGAEIFNNVIENYATAKKNGHDFGIIVGGGTGGKCYNNLITKGSGAGIGVFGLADNSVFNNIIVDAGRSGIFCDERSEPGAGYRLINNTIVNPAIYGIDLYSESVPENLVMNNVIVNPGAFASIGERAYIKPLGANVPLTARNNFTTLNIALVLFTNFSKGDYTLLATSPVINTGGDIAAHGIIGDFYGNPRLSGSRYDIGAVEF